ncbi:hypothetical protein HK098_006954, partial [Nowakowskiella sp. JEL0407]
AAKLYKRSGNIQKAIEMYTDLNMWDYATQVASESATSPSSDASSLNNSSNNTILSEILKQKAQTLQSRNDLLAAATTYTEIGDYIQAITILGTNGYLDNLIQIARKLNKSETKALQKCVMYFRHHNHTEYAIETLVKLGDVPSLLQLYVEMQNWDDAFRVTELHPEYQREMYVPYADWLATKDRFVEAQLYYRKSGHAEKSFQVLEQLLGNSVSEQRFDDAGYYYWLKAQEFYESLPDNKPTEELTMVEKKFLKFYYECIEFAEIYYAYHHIQRYLDQPFTTHLPESLWNMARFVLSSLTNLESTTRTRKNTNIKLSRVLGAYKFARHAYEKIQKLVIPSNASSIFTSTSSEWPDLIEIGALTIRSKPFSDKDDLAVPCYACSFLNPVLNTTDTCVNCKEPFVYSFFSFNNLPVVRFYVDAGISDEEAVKLIETDPPVFNASGGNEGKVCGGLVSTISENGLFDDPRKKNFRQASQKDGLLNGHSATKPKSVVDMEEGNNISSRVSRTGLLQMNKYDVLIQRFRKRCIPNRYYRIVGGAAVVCCGRCQHFMLQDEWCFQLLQHGVCAFCRTAHDLQEGRF